jgi:hypothetical protein
VHVCTDVTMLQAMIHLTVFKSKYSFSNQYYNDIVKLIIELIPAKLNMSKDFSAMDTSHRRRGHLQLEGKPHRGNASMDDIDVAAAATFSSPPTVTHLSLLSIVLFVIRANVERLAYSSIYVFKHPSSSVRRNFINRVLYMGGSGEGECGSTGNDVAP